MSTQKKIKKDKIVSYRVPQKLYNKIMRLGYSPTKLSRAGFITNAELVITAEECNQPINNWKREDK